VIRVRAGPAHRCCSCRLPPCAGLWCVSRAGLLLAPNDRRRGGAVDSFRLARRGRAAVPAWDDSALDTPGAGRACYWRSSTRPWCFTPSPTAFASGSLDIRGLIGPHDGVAKRASQASCCAFFTFTRFSPSLSRRRLSSLPAGLRGVRAQSVAAAAVGCGRSFRTPRGSLSSRPFRTSRRGLRSGSG
jgi:hypothetical protein